MTQNKVKLKIGDSLYSRENDRITIYIVKEIQITKDCTKYLICSLNTPEIIYFYVNQENCNNYFTFKEPYKNIDAGKHIDLYGKKFFISIEDLIYDSEMIYPDNNSLYQTPEEIVEKMKRKAIIEWAKKADIKDIDKIIPEILKILDINTKNFFNQRISELL